MPMTGKNFKHKKNLTISLVKFFIGNFFVGNFYMCLWSDINYGNEFHA